jgi:hypothetical protein
VPVSDDVVVKEVIDDEAFAATAAKAMAKLKKPAQPVAAQQDADF